jgi:hypothetical protein
MSEVVFVILILFLSLFSAIYLSIGIRNKVIVFLLFIFSFSTINFAIRGLNLGDLFLYFSNLILISLFSVYNFKSLNIKKFNYAIFLVIILNYYFIYLQYIGNSWFNSNSGYGDESNNLIRFIGIYTAPAVLSLVAILIILTGIFNESLILKLFYISSGLAFGLLSGNRSFLLGLSVILLLSLIFIRGSFLKVSFLFVIFFFLYPFLESYDLFQILLARFDPEIISIDVETRVDSEVGLVVGLKSFLRNPIFGNIISRDGILYAEYDGKLSSVNNGWISLLAFNGIVFSIIYIYLYIFSIYTFFNKVKSDKDDILSWIGLFYLITVAFLNLVDAYYSNLSVLFFILFSRLVHSGKSNKNRINQLV